MSALFCHSTGIFATFTVALAHAHTKELFQQSNFLFLLCLQKKKKPQTKKPKHHHIKTHTLNSLLDK